MSSGPRVAPMTAGSLHVDHLECNSLTVAGRVTTDEILHLDGVTSSLVGGGGGGGGGGGDANISETGPLSSQVGVAVSGARLAQHLQSYQTLIDQNNPLAPNLVAFGTQEGYKLDPQYIMARSILNDASTEVNVSALDFKALNQIAEALISPSGEVVTFRQVIETIPTTPYTFASTGGGVNASTATGKYLRFDGLSSVNGLPTFSYQTPPGSGGGGGTVDSALTAGSVNAVQNGLIVTALAGKLDVGTHGESNVNYVLQIQPDGNTPANYVPTWTENRLYASSSSLPGGGGRLPPQQIEAQLGGTNCSITHDEFGTLSGINTNSSIASQIASVLPTLATGNLGDVLTIASTSSVGWSTPATGLPEYTSGDSNKFLKVNGDGSALTWDLPESELGSLGAAGTVLTVQEGGTTVGWNAVPTELPDYSSADVANVLSVQSNGGTNTLTWSAPASGLPTLPGSGSNGYVLTIQSNLTQVAWNAPATGLPEYSGESNKFLKVNGDGSALTWDLPESELGTLGAVGTVLTVQEGGTTVGWTAPVTELPDYSSTAVANVLSVQSSGGTNTLTWSAPPSSVPDYSNATAGQFLQVVAPPGGSNQIGWSTFAAGAIPLSGSAYPSNYQTLQAFADYLPTGFTYIDNLGGNAAIPTHAQLYFMGVTNGVPQFEWRDPDGTVGGETAGTAGATNKRAVSGNTVYTALTTTFQNIPLSSNTSFRIKMNSANGVTTDGASGNGTNNDVIVEYATTGTISSTSGEHEGGKDTDNHAYDSKHVTAMLQGKGGAILCAGYNPVSGTTGASANAASEANPGYMHSKNAIFLPGAGRGPWEDAITIKAKTKVRMVKTASAIRFCEFGFNNRNTYSSIHLNGNGSQGNQESRIDLTRFGQVRGMYSGGPGHPDTWEGVPGGQTAQGVADERYGGWQVGCSEHFSASNFSIIAPSGWRMAVSQIRTNGNAEITNGFEMVKDASSGAVTIYSHAGAINTSDDRYKSRTTDVGDAMALIRQVRVRDYVKHVDHVVPLGVEDSDLTGVSTRPEIGVVAQEVEAISGLERLVFTHPTANEDGLNVKGVNYQELQMLTLRALQQSDARVTALEARVAALEAAGAST